MSLNSVNTNVGAQIALQSLNITSSQLAATEKQISTGYRVADATDDGAAYYYCVIRREFREGRWQHGHRAILRAIARAIV